MQSLDEILSDLGYRERIECYGPTQSTPLKAPGRIRILAENMVKSYHAHGFEPEKMTIIPAPHVPHSEAYKRNLPLAIYSAP